MVEVAEVKQQIQQARVQIQTKRAEAKDIKQKLITAKERLPDVTSQRALRSKYAGLQGRARRQQVEQAEKEIQKRVNLVEGYEKNITNYEKDIINPVETQVADYETQASSNKRVMDAYTASVKKVGVGSISGLIIKRYNLNSQEEKAYRDLVNSQGKGAISIAKQQKTNIDNLNTIIEKYNVGDGLSSQEKLKLSNYEQAGVVSFSKTIPEIKNDFAEVPEIKDFQFSDKFSTRTDKVKDNFKITGMGISGSLFPSVSAANYSEPQSIKGSTAFDKDGFSSVSGTPSSKDIFISSGLDTVVRPSTRVGGWISRFKETFKGDITGAATETYDPKLGFISATYGPGEGGTVTSRSPTISDIPTIAKIEEVQFKGNLFSVPPSQIVSQASEFKQLTKGLDTLEGKELTQRLDKIKNVGGNIKETTNNFGKTTYDITSPSVGVGFGMNKRQISLDKLDTKTETGLYFSASRERYVKPYSKKGAEFIGYPSEITIPESQRTIYTPQFGSIQKDPLTGKIVTGYKDVTIPERTISPSGIVSEVVSGGTYLIPYVWGTEVVGKAGELVLKEQSLLKGGIQFVKNYPVETAIVGGAGLLKAGIGISKIIPQAKFGGLSSSQYTRALESAEKELAQLEKKSVRWLAIQEKGTGKVNLKGYQDTSTFGREVNVAGKIQKTKKGFEFIPESSGTSTVGGQVKLGNKPVSYFEVQKFQTGSKTTMIPAGSVGDVKMFYQVGTSGTIPEAGSFILAKPNVLAKSINKPVKIEKQFKENIVLGGDGIKEISDAGVFQLKENVFLTIEEGRGLGLTLIKEAPKTDKIKIIVSEGTKPKTPFSTTFQTGQIIEAPPTRIVPPKTIKPTEVISDIKPLGENLPLIVGGTGTKTRLPYSGTGLYEQTSQVSFTKIAPETLQINKQNILIDTQQISQVKTNLEVGTNLKSVQEFKPQQITKQIQEPKSKLEYKQVSVPALTIKTKQTQVLESKQRTRQTSTPKTKQTTKIKTPGKIIPPKPSGLLSRLSKKVDEDGSFEAFFKKKGKEISLGTFGTKSEAERTLKRKLTGTLSASGGIKSDKKKIKSSDIDLGFEFRKSKLNQFLVVEKKSKRLRKGTTGKQVQAFRPTKSKSKKKGLFGGF